jgi:hypothetical protein
MSEINAEFGRGNNLNAYRGVTWYTDTYGVSGTFSSGTIYIGDFYNKRASSPPAPYLAQGTVTAAQSSAYYNFWGYSEAIRFWPAQGNMSQKDLTNGAHIYSLITDGAGFYIIANTNFTFNYLQIDGIGTWYAGSGQNQAGAGDATGWFQVDSFWFYGWNAIPPWSGTYNFRIT